MMIVQWFVRGGEALYLKEFWRQRLLEASTAARPSLPCACSLVHFLPASLQKPQLSSLLHSSTISPLYEQPQRHCHERFPTSVHNIQLLSRPYVITGPICDIIDVDSDRSPKHTRAPDLFHPLTSLFITPQILQHGVEAYQ